MLPEDKQQAIIGEFGGSGERWVREFPALIERCVARWGLELSARATAGLPLNVIFFAEMAQGEQVVLKVGYPHPEQKTEMIALPLYEGRCAPRLIDCDEKLGAILMERIVPGMTFREYPLRTTEAPAVFADISVELDAVPGLPAYQQWLERAFAQFRRRFDDSHPFLRHIALAERTWVEILKHDRVSCLLHGDLHHENLLQDRVNGWRAIDPKGVIGPRIMEPARFLHNFMADDITGVESLAEAGEDQLCEILEARYGAFAEIMQQPAEMLARATYVDDVLSHCWTINDGGSIEYVRVEAARRMLTRY